jgi:predicted N-acyltransferase
MTTAQTTFPELIFAPRENAGQGAARPGLLSRLHAHFARFGEYFQSYDDYFAEVERSLPMHVREQRRQRKESNRLLLIAAVACR